MNKSLLDCANEGNVLLSYGSANLLQIAEDLSENLPFNREEQETWKLIRELTYAQKVHDESDFGDGK